MSPLAEPIISAAPALEVLQKGDGNLRGTFRVFLCCSSEHVIGVPILSAHIALIRLVATWHQVNGGGSLMGTLWGFEVSAASIYITDCRLCSQPRPPMAARLYLSVTHLEMT